MDKEHKKDIKELMIDCSEGCKCHNPGIEDLCKAEDIGLEGFVKCLEENPSMCDHSIPYGYSWYCSCAPRIYIAKELKK